MLVQDDAGRAQYYVLLPFVLLQLLCMATITVTLQDADDQTGNVTVGQTQTQTHTQMLALIPCRLPFHRQVASCAARMGTNFPSDTTPCNMTSSPPALLLSDDLWARVFSLIAEEVNTDLVAVSVAIPEEVSTDIRPISWSTVGV